MATEQNIDKQAALSAAMKQIEKQFGKGAIMKLGDVGDIDIKTVPTGILPLDVALGVGGLPRGRIIEIYGPEAGGKTTVTLHMIAEMQRHGGFYRRRTRFRSRLCKKIGRQSGRTFGFSTGHRRRGLRNCGFAD